MTKQQTKPETNIIPEPPAPKIGIIGKISIPVVIIALLAWPAVLIVLNYRQRTYHDANLEVALKNHYDAWYAALDEHPDGMVGPETLIREGRIGLDNYFQIPVPGLELGDTNFSSASPSTQPDGSISRPASENLYPVFMVGDFIFCYPGWKPKEKNNDNRLHAFTRAKLHGSENGRFVLYMNGETGWLKDQEFTALIIRENHVRKKAGLAEIPPYKLRR